MKKSEMFREAKKYLWDGVIVNYKPSKERYICLCLVEASTTHLGTLDTFYACADMVEKAIMGCNTFEDYLTNKEGRKYDSYTREYLQSRRLALLERLILEAEAEENKEESQ